MRAAYAQALEERTALLEQVHRQTAEHAVAQERLRIARELHDVVAHTMSVVAVQSGVAMHVLDSQPDRARAAVQEIATSSRSAMAELRRLLGVLRADDQPRGALAPSPALADVDALAATLERAGVPVEVRVAGEPCPLPAATELTAYRIVQEALTNVVKHAGAGARARVTLRFTAAELGLEIEDDAGAGLGSASRTAPPRTDGGVGLTGMRERVAAFGGGLEAGPTDRGYRVRATLPLSGART